MALTLPDRFLVRPVPEFVAGLKIVHANFWHWHSKGDMQFERPAGLMAQGSLDAMLWLSGQSPFPPCYSTPLPRTRSNLLKLIRFAEMVLTGEGEQADREDGAVDIMNHYGQAGARAVYAWALGMTDSLPGDELLSEEQRAARQHYETVQAHTRNAA